MRSVSQGTVTILPQCKVTAADQYYSTGNCGLFRVESKSESTEEPAHVFIRLTCLSGPFCNPFICKHEAGILS